MVSHRALFMLSSLFALGLSQSLTSVDVSLGKIEGAKCAFSTAISYLAIPYAQPPINNLRFAAPQSYNGPFPGGSLLATTPSPSCIQSDTVPGLTGPQSEDCLYLDIWVPANSTSSSKLPVKVWIYGGSDDSGSISEPIFDGCDVASDSIFVSINFRVGAFGFLALNTANITGNFAVQDILMGLQWVQTNIAAFGGDPTKVLLFGQSAGAGLAWTISTLPNAKSLIAAIISESGAGRALPAASAYQSFGASYASMLHCSPSDIACFRSKSTAALVAATPVINGSGFVTTARFQPYVDGSIIATDPTTVNPQVPILAGSNSQDGAIFAYSQFGAPQSVHSSDYTNFLQENFNTSASQVASYYPLSSFASQQYPAYTAISTIITDSQYKCPAYRVISQASSAGVPAYTYVFAHTPSCPWDPTLNTQTISFLGPTHTAEIPFVLANLNALPRPNGTCTMTSQESALSSAMTTAWTSMAVIGKPASSEAAWPSFNTSASLGVTFGSTPTVGYINYTMCEFWDQLNSAQPPAPSPSGTGTGKKSAASPAFSGYWRPALLFSGLAVVLGFF